MVGLGVARLECGFGSEVVLWTDCAHLIPPGLSLPLLCSRVVRFWPVLLALGVICFFVQAGGETLAVLSALWNLVLVAFATLGIGIGISLAFNIPSPCFLPLRCVLFVWSLNGTE